MSLVIDNGTHTVKFGLSTDKSPQLIENIVGFERGNKELDLSQIQVGMDAIKKFRKDTAKIVSTRYPIQRGMIVDWTHMEAVWRFCFAQADAKECPVFMAMNALTPPHQRESACEMMFELFDVPKFFCETPGLLSHYDSFPNEDGVIVESGSGVTNIIPIFKGIPDRKRILSSPICGQDVSSYLSKLILLRGYNCDPKEEWKIVSHIKENISYVSPDFDDEIKICKKDPNEFRQELEVRTGEKIVLDSECFRCTEIMFDPTLIGVNQPGLPELVYQAMSTFSGEFPNVVLSGGNMKITGMVERMEKELKVVMKQHGKKKTINKPILLDDCSAWKGGAKMANEKINWITKKDYDENGGSIVSKNCF